MTWDYFYERYDNWSDSTFRQRISALENAGPIEEVSDVTYDRKEKDREDNDRLVMKCISLGMEVPFEEILEFDGTVSEKVADELVKAAIRQKADLDTAILPDFDWIKDKDTINSMISYALERNKSFSIDTVLNLEGMVSKEFLDRAAMAISEKLTEDDLLALEGVISEKALEKLEDRVWPGERKTEPADQPDIVQKTEKRHPFLAAFWLFGALGAAGNRQSRSNANASPFRIGDHVRVRYRGQEGTVVDINGDLIMVSMNDGARVDSYTASQLEKAW